MPRILTRRTVLAGVLAYSGLVSVGDEIDSDPRRSPNLPLKRDGDDPGSYAARAAAIVVVLRSLGLDEKIQFATPRDVCRLVFDADQIVTAAAMARDGFPVSGLYESEGSIISADELARLIADELAGDLGRTVPDMRTIERMLEAADRLIIERFVREADEAQADI